MILKRVKDRLASIPSLAPSSLQEWSLAIWVALLTLLPAIGKWTFFEFLPSLAKLRPSVYRPVSDVLYTYRSQLPTLAADDPTLTFAFIVGSFCLCITSFILIVAFLVYIISRDEKRIARAGRIVTLTLTFITTSGLGVWAYLGFTAKG
jgi:hypothetical protein